MNQIIWIYNTFSHSQAAPSRLAFFLGERRPLVATLCTTPMIVLILIFGLYKTLFFTLLPEFTFRSLILTFCLLMCPFSFPFPPTFARLLIHCFLLRPPESHASQESLHGDHGGVSSSQEPWCGRWGPGQPEWRGTAAEHQWMHKKHLHCE